MKSRHLKFYLLAGIFCSLVPLAASAMSETVTNFAVNAKLDRANILDITEGIDYDFGDAQVHDVVRTIPVNYHDDQGRTFNLKFSLKSAKVDGETMKISSSSSDNNLIRLILPAGQNKPKYHFDLRYTLAPVVLIGDVGDVFKLSVTGIAWNVPINQASITLTMSGIPAEDITCYTGAQGSTTSSCTVTTEGETFRILTDRQLQAGEGLSIYSNFPHHTFSSYLQPTTTAQSWSGLILAISIPLAFIIGFAILVAHRFKPKPVVEEDQSGRL